jgi:hypothetical protein
MNDETTNLYQADENILTPTVSDEALEAAVYGLGCGFAPTEGCLPPPPSYSPACFPPQQRGACHHRPATS